MNQKAVEALDAAIPDRAVPADGAARYDTQVSTCMCGWDIVRFLTAESPTWLHAATMRPQCRPWTAPEVDPQGRPTP